MPMADKSEYKTPSMEGEGKGDGHQYGESPGYQSESQYLGNSPSEKEMGHWTPMAIEPMDYDDDDDESYSQILELETAMAGQVRIEDDVLPSNIVPELNTVCHICWDNFDIMEKTPS